MYVPLSKDQKKVLKEFILTPSFVYALRFLTPEQRRNKRNREEMRSHLSTVAMAVLEEESVYA